MTRFTLLFIICLSVLPVNAQSDTEEMLAGLFSRMLMAENDFSRIQTNDSIKSLIDGYVRSDSIFLHRFVNLRNLGQITSPDSLLKIVSWNLPLKESGGRYFCYLVRRGEEGKSNRVDYLTTSYHTDPVKTDTTYKSSDWYGALYYDLRSYRVNNEKFWVMLGLDFGNPLITRKVIDVLNFTNADSLYFGRKWFETDSLLKYREVFEYSSEGVMTLRFLNDTTIVFDHLVPFSPEMTGNRQFYGPDYSYDAFMFKNGIWNFSLNVDARNEE